MDKEDLRLLAQEKDLDGPDTRSVKFKRLHHKIAKMALPEAKKNRSTFVTEFLEKTGVLMDIGDRTLY
ncbi:hypothetical protein NPIL_443731 [Nephila pilipes]|uniref:Uncharacterized protein n=1 Tax=Nephila pilipes TaxID=299642 RepID=A0A8X6P436_NEPPI|nr:hypothetical protein NPIL_443731 [Nephila pilipes]